ncbi:MAG: CoA pyrophosphatase [Rhizobiaceae bacterium]
MTMVAGTGFSIEDWRRRAGREDGRAEEEHLGDHALNPDLRDLILDRKLRDAAVLIAVVERNGVPSVILTQRTEQLRSHSGQVAFPGGRVDATDLSAEAAALRETHEEIGLAPEAFEVVGRMPDYASGSGYRISPVLAVADPSADMRINPAEVADAFEVPLEFLMDPRNHKTESRIWQGRERYFWVMPFGERYIWGVTAGIIRTLYERLYA